VRALPSPCNVNCPKLSVLSKYGKGGGRGRKAEKREDSKTVVGELEGRIKHMKAIKEEELKLASELSGKAL